MIISVASGKGGTGKTTIATNLALCLDEEVQLDPAFTRAMVQGQTIFEHNGHSQGAQAVQRVWDSVCKTMAL